MLWGKSDDTPPDDAAVAQGVKEQHVCTIESLYFAISRPARYVLDSHKATKTHTPALGSLALTVFKKRQLLVWPDTVSILDQDIASRFNTKGVDFLLSTKLELSRRRGLAGSSLPFRKVNSDVILSRT